MEAPHTPDVEANPQEPPGGTWTEPSGARRRAAVGPRSTTHDMVLPERRSARTATGAARRGAAQRGHLPAARPAVPPGGQETPGPGFRCYGSGWGAATARRANTKRRGLSTARPPGLCSGRAQATRTAAGAELPAQGARRRSCCSPAG